MSLIEKAADEAAFQCKQDWRRSEILYANPSVKTDWLTVSPHTGGTSGQSFRIPLFQAVAHAWRMRPVAFCVISNCANFPKSLRDGVESCELPSFAIPVACRNASGVPLTARACTPRLEDRQNPRLVDRFNISCYGHPRANCQRSFLSLFRESSLQEAPCRLSRFHQALRPLRPSITFP